MKRLLSVIILLLAVINSYAQNTFPSTGNVGIGTTSPATSLDVWGQQRIISSSATAFVAGNGPANLHITYSGQTGNTWFYTFSSQNFNTGTDGNTRFGIGSVLFFNNAQIMAYQQPLTILRAWPGNGAPGGLVIDNDTRSAVPSIYRIACFRITGVEKSYIDQTGGAYFGGNVVIGTNSPSSMLDIEGGDLTVHTTNNQSNLIVGSAVAGKTYIRLTSSADANGYGVIQSVLSSGSNWGNTLINPLGGNVGIGTGTSQPGQALTVNGTVHATAVLIDQNVPHPDYVFDKDYELATLKDVKTYIDKNHHLPEMPSASQVAKEGMNIGEMNTKLLKKIEELTLYLIEKDNELSKQKSRIKAQQQQLNKINRKLNLN